MKVLIETSARHVHLCQKDYEQLFGEQELTIKKYLSQPGQFCANERVELVGPKNSIQNVSILGPFRNASQVEVSITDTRTLGVEAPIRESGDLKGSSSIKLIGPKGEIILNEGLIVAKRHIHMNEREAKALGLQDKQCVKVEVLSKRPVVFEETVVRVNKNYALAMHIDTDEANACGIDRNQRIEGTIIEQ